jgi:LysR family nitrogen assimilation transcriptional regulator
VLVPGVFERCQRSMTDTHDNSGRPIAMRPLLVEPFALVEPASRPFRPVVPVAQLAHIPLLMTTLHRKLVERELMPLGVHLNVLSALEELIIAELT